MKAWRVYEPNKMVFETLDSRTADAGMVKLKILSRLLTRFEESVYTGKARLKDTPRILGRNCVAMVTETGEGVTNFQRGDRVISEAFLPCGSCYNCKNGKSSECEAISYFGSDIDGFMSDFAIVNAAQLYKLPEKIKNDEAVFLEAIALAINIINKLDMEKGEHLVVVGANCLGIILSQVAMYYQIVPILVDTNKDRLEVASSCGVYYTINSVEEDTKNKIFSFTGGNMADCVAYASDAPLPLLQSLDYAKKNGKVTIFGYANTGNDIVSNLNSLFNRQLSLIGITSSGKNISTAINILVNKGINIAPLISKIIPLTELENCIKYQIEYPTKYLAVLVEDEE